MNENPIMQMITCAVIDTNENGLLWVQNKKIKNLEYNRTLLKIYMNHIPRKIWKRDLPWHIIYTK